MGIDLIMDELAALHIPDITEGIAVGDVTVSK